jgi:RNA polymerase sigma-70 factor, ECF subfamily
MIRVRSAPTLPYPSLVFFAMTDGELLDRLRAGDQAAFDTIFRTWYAPLVRLAEGMLHERAVAEEIVQDVMLELWRRRENLAAEGSAQAYLFQSTRNRALNHLRHVRVQKRGEPHLAMEEVRASTAHAEMVEGEIEVALREAVADLPDRCREVFELSRVHGLKYAEIANVLGVSVKAVEAQMGKALSRLRTRLAPWLPRGDSL